MHVEKVKNYLDKFGRSDDVLEMDTSTATVQLAADALGTIPARIAKSIALRGNGEGHILVVTAGDARMDNRKFRDEFDIKPRMLSPDETLEATGYAVGGVCPFALPDNGILLVLDKSLQRFTTVYPACGSSNSAIEVTLAQLEEYTGCNRWVDVCKDWDPELT